MKRQSKNKLLNYTMQLGIMLLSEASGEQIGPKNAKKAVSDVPFSERRALLAELNRTLLVKHKVDPEGEENGLDSMRSLLNGDSDGSGKTKSGARSTANGSSSIPSFSSISSDATDTDETPIN